MTQHINLLRKQRLVPLSLIWGGLGVLGFVMVFSGYGLWLLRENSQSEARLQTLQAELITLREEVVRANQRSPGGVSLQDDISRLTQVARAYGGLLEQVKAGRLGLERGYLDHLTTLARTVEPGVWITQVSLSEAGRKLTVQGKALTEQSVLTYVDRLNQAYQAQGLALATLEMSVDGGLASSQAPAGKTISFRLN